MLVREIMSAPPVWVGEHATCREALETMARRRVTALPVLDHDRRLVGILSEVDLLRATLEADPRSHLGPTHAHGEALPGLVSELMSRDPVTVAEGADVAEVAHLFVRTSFKSLPVMRDARLVGVLSRSDVVRALARPDDAIAHDVMAALRELGDPAWRATVRHGEVIVDGPRTTREEDLAVHLTAGIIGVRSVRVDAGTEALLDAPTTRTGPETLSPDA